jgi:sugar lactone lactonase YvrE
MGWNLADDIMFFTDSDDKNIYAFDFDAERGAISNQRVFYHVSGTDIFPDGLAVDQEDCVWSALWGGGKVLRIAPDGIVIGEVIMPTTYVTCPAFIGTELLITTRGDPEYADVSIKRGGDVYKVEVGTRGVLKHEFHLI